MEQHLIIGHFLFFLPDLILVNTSIDSAYKIIPFIETSEMARTVDFWAWLSGYTYQVCSSGCFLIALCLFQGVIGPTLQACWNIHMSHLSAKSRELYLALRKLSKELQLLVVLQLTMISR